MTGDEYLGEIVANITDCEAEIGTEPTLEELKADVQESIEEFEALRPPASVEDAHESIAESTRRVLDGVESAETLSDLQDDADFGELVAELSQQDEVWSAALRENFGKFPFKHEGASMEPAFSAGEGILFEEYDGELERWDIVAFEFPLDRERTFIKRVVGLPGETIEVRNDVILVDGTPVAGDEYALADMRYEYGPRAVPPDAYFVLGDNRRNSFDSHAWGGSCRPEENCDFVPADAILGELPPETVGEFCDDADATAVPTETG